jgi:hypothetical protein
MLLLLKCGIGTNRMRGARDQIEWTALQRTGGGVGRCLSRPLMHSAIGLHGLLRAVITDVRDLKRVTSLVRLGRV